jgi:argininosuccinate lyase
MPFRDAYRTIAKQIEAGAFKRPRGIQYTHIGSIGNLANEHIRMQMKQVLKEFDFDQINRKLAELTEI